jgi:hypothetical protein
MCKKNLAEFLVEYLMPLKPEDLNVAKRTQAGQSFVERKRISVCPGCRDDTDFDEFFRGS